MNADRWQRAKEIYQSIIERAPEQRDEFLAQACAGDESLQREVESLLACRPGAEDVMASPALDVAARALAREQSTESETDLAGHVLAHFRILSRIGAGGMGVVYRAEDLRLGRAVALKVISAELTGDRQAQLRFQREARAISALNHPHICTLHDVGEHEGRTFLVMEHVEGETLSERLARGPLKVDKAVQICCQIAAGLEAAHEQGIIHRDLKPANVKITPEGRVKILDFGLARILHDRAGEAGSSQAAKVPVDKTLPGLVLGTAAYVSPEQAEGKPVDKRTDVWAFGCVLFECLTGKRAFKGKTIADTIAAIFKEEPDWQALPAAAPESLRAVLRRCLQKDPALRMRDIGDARIEIGEPAVRDRQDRPARRRFTLWRWGAAAVLVLLTGILVGPALMKYFQPPSPEPVVSSIQLEPGYRLAGMSRGAELIRPTRTAVAISSDGSFIIYSANEENAGSDLGTGLTLIDVALRSDARTRLFVRRISQKEARPIPGTEGGYSPFLSPDNRWVGFWAEGKLKKIPVEGGIATELCDAHRMFGASWNRDNRIVFSDWVSAGLSIISAEGGTAKPLTRPDPKREEISHRLPFWLPSQPAILFTVMRHTFDWKPRLAVLRVDTGEWKTLLDDAADARFVPTGHLVFLRNGVLMAVKFDPSGLKVVGEPQPLVKNVMQAFATADLYNTAAAQVAISDTGWLIYAAGGVAPEPVSSLVWVDQKGNEEPVTAVRGPFSLPRLSPDEKRIAYATSGRDSRIWVLDLARGTFTPVTDEGHASLPVWTATGKYIVFSWMKSGRPGAFWRPYDRSAPMQPFFKPAREELGAITPDGKSVPVAVSDPGTSWDISLFDTQSGKLTPFLNSQFAEAYPEVSPDGRWLAYTSTDNREHSEVFVTDFPGKTFIKQISAGGGHSPMWSRKGRKLFYRGQGYMWAVDFETEGGFTPGRPQRLFKDAAYVVCTPMRCGDISIDSQRFLMVKIEPLTPAPVTELILVQNWFTELKRRF